MNSPSKFTHIVQRLAGVTALATALSLMWLAPAAGAPEDQTPAAVGNITFAAAADTAKSAEVAPDATVSAPSLWLDPDEISQWDASRAGITGVVQGFNPGSTVTVTVNTMVAGTGKVDAVGEFGFQFTADLPVGNIQVKVASGSLQAVATFKVIADGPYYAGWDIDPRVSANRFVLTVAQQAATPIELDLRNWPDEVPVDIAVNGKVVDTVMTNSIGNLDYVLDEPLKAGKYKVTAIHPAGSDFVEFDIVPNAAGAKPPAGKYSGTSIQTHASSNELSEKRRRPISFEVDANGNISKLTGEYFWACVTGGYHGSGSSEFNSMPATRITAGRPFEIEWETVSTTYTLVGVVNADGSGSGRVFASLGVCGSTIMTWSTAAAGSAAGPYVRTAPYTLAGTHDINGRKWRTACEPYSQTERCRTEISATTVAVKNGQFVRESGWAFNNLTYLPYMTREAWGTNPLAVHNMNGFASGGRQWRTECDTAQTGRGACRSYTLTTVYSATAKSTGGYTFGQKNEWVFNNIVMFGGPNKK